MASDPRLTILLTLKGRHLFTLRWLWHANRINLPFRIFIADGEVHPAIARVIEDRSVFPNLEIEYHRYHDRTFHDFYQKLDDALCKITTPYVMMADNDDFLFPSGIIRGLHVLERSTDYVCAGGCVGHFELGIGRKDSSNLTGRIKKIWYQQSKAYRPFDLASSLASERVIDVCADSLTVHYNVYRVNALRRLASEQLKINFSRLENAELFWKLRTATLGKLKSDPSYISYLRQVGTSLNPSRMDKVGEVLTSEAYLNETRSIMKSIASISSKSDGIIPEVIEKELDACFAENLKAKLIQVFGWRSAVKLSVKKCLPELFLQRLRLAGERIRSGKSSAMGGRPISREQLFMLATKAGATEELVNDQNKELVEIEATLQSREFLTFIQLHACTLLPQSQENHGGSLGDRNFA